MSQFSPATLLNPKSLKKQTLVNGTPPTFPSANLTLDHSSTRSQPQAMENLSGSLPDFGGFLSAPPCDYALSPFRMSMASEGQPQTMTPYLESEVQPQFENGTLAGTENLTSEETMPSHTPSEAPHSHSSPSLFAASAPPTLPLQPLPGLEDSLIAEEPLANHTPNDEGRQKPSSPATFERTHFDPRTLLSPKSAVLPQQANGQNGSSSRKRSTPPFSPNPSFVPEPQFDFGGALATPFDDVNPENGEGDSSGYTSLIEQTHGVAERDVRAIKKLKTTHDANSTTWSQGKGSIISKHFKDLKKENPQGSELPDQEEHAPNQDSDSLPKQIETVGQGMSQQPEQVVDLTEDADDELTITGSHTNVPDPGDEVVCFGTVENASISAHRIPFPSPTAKSLLKGQWPAIKVTLARQKARKTLHVLAYDGQSHDFGQLHPHCAYGIAQVIDAGLITRLQGRIPNRKREPWQVPGQDISERLPLMLTLYGKRKHAKPVTLQLARTKVALKRPVQFDRAVEYFNPFEEESEAKARVHDVSRPQWNPVGLSRTIEEIESSVMHIFETSQEAAELPEMEPDPNVIKTPLLEHQKQALYFMTAKELGHAGANEEVDSQGHLIIQGNSLWRLIKERTGNSHYYNVVSGHTQREAPPICRGGILADMMGLGKTLSVLALCASTKQAAKDWARNAPTVMVDGTRMKNVKSTLLVAPLSVVQNWEEQIKVHTIPGTMSIYVYHAKNRESNLDALGKFDVVVTTYSIVSSELHGIRRGRNNDRVSPFRVANFFRIVLDEAHAIKEPTTLQSRAICALSGERRWGVTGTPIQNRLDDFGSLLRFIKLYPFETQFRSAIITPFKNADPDVIPKLRILVDSVTLRRTKDRLDLPKRNDVTTHLTMTEHEAQLYKLLAVDGRRRANATRGQKMGGKGLQTILRSILACRTVCDAADLLNEEDMKLVEGYSEGMPIALDDEDASPELPDRAAYEMLSLFEESDLGTCARCKDNFMEKEYESGTIGYMLACFQVICPSCIAEFRSFLEQTTSGISISCPFCEMPVTTSLFELTQDGFDRAKNRAEELKKKPRQKMVSRYTGPSTKTAALLDALEDARKEDNIFPSQPKNKSVVFSCWTSYLDLIEIALEDAEPPFNYVRLDGKMSREKRKASLQAFDADPEVTVLIASIGVGGLGLNLTCANQVFIMEPQWNPAAEAQAVDRVHRLGQKRDVKTTRYILEGSIELGMVEMQQKKLDLADLSMTKKKLEKKETAKERLLGLVGLFK